MRKIIPGLIGIGLLAALVVTLRSDPAPIAPPPPPPDASSAQEVRGIVHRVYEKGELSLVLRGKTLNNSDPNTYSITGLDATLYTRPSVDKPDVRRIEIRAEAGTYDENTKLLTLSGRTRLQTEDHDDLSTEALTFDRTRSILSTDRPFVLNRPQMIVTGVGFEADDEFGNIKVHRNARVEFKGQPGAVMSGSDSAGPTGMLTILKTPGQMTIVRLPQTKPPQLRMEMPQDCDMVRITTDEKTRKETRSHLSAARATFLASEIPDPRSKEDEDPGRPPRTIIQITSLTAEGNVHLTGGENEMAQCERLVWNRKDGRTDLFHGTMPVLIKQRGNTVNALAVSVEHATNKAVCTGNVTAELRRDPEDAPMNVTAESLIIAGRTPEEGQESSGPAVTFDADRLIARSRRASVLKTDQIEIRAPTIEFDPTTGTSVIGGPKIIVLKPKAIADEKTPKDPMKITCEGIAVLDRENQFIYLERRVRIVGPKFTLESDRAVITLDESGSEMTLLRARGRVMVRQAGGRRIACHRLVYDPTTEDMRVFGFPTASIRTGKSDLRCEEALINAKDGTLKTIRKSPESRIQLRLKRKP